MNGENPELRVIERQREADPDLAARKCSRYVRAHPREPAGFVLLGNLLLQLQRVEEAKIAFEQAMEIDPEDAATHLGLGRVALIRGVPAEARHRFERAAWRYFLMRLSSTAVVILWTLAYPFISNSSSRATNGLMICRISRFFSGAINAS